MLVHSPPIPRRKTMLLEADSVGSEDVISLSGQLRPNLRRASSAYKSSFNFLKWCGIPKVTADKTNITQLGSIDRAWLCGQWFRVELRCMVGLVVRENTGRRWKHILPGNAVNEPREKALTSISSAWNMTMVIRMPLNKFKSIIELNNNNNCFWQKSGALPTYMYY